MTEIAPPKGGGGGAPPPLPKWTPWDYTEYSRRWSLLRELSTALITGYAISMTSSADSNFWHRRPSGVFPRPMIVFEKAGGERHGGMLGAPGRANEYVLWALWPETNVDGTNARPDALLDVLNEELINFLDGRKIPFYDCRNYSFGAKTPEYDISLRYLSDSRESETKDKDRNVLVIKFNLEI